MGLNYNYLLYFKKEHLWDALQGVVRIAERSDPFPTTVHFPNHNLVLPIVTGFQEENELSYDKPEFKFDISLFFDEDKAILDYLSHNGSADAYRAPPDPDGIRRVAIGLIYLTVYADLSEHYGFQKPSDLVLFSFGTTGTRMSILFSESESIRRTFSELLENNAGVIGIFDWENDYGELFWFNGKSMQVSLSNNYLLPEEIEAELKRGW
jgi:hypothetical protein